MSDSSLSDYPGYSSEIFQRSKLNPAIDFYEGNRGTIRTKTLKLKQFFQRIWIIYVGSRCIWKKYVSNIDKNFDGKLGGLIEFDCDDDGNF